MHKKIQSIIIAVIFIGLGAAYLVYRNQENASYQVYFEPESGTFTQENPPDDAAAGMQETQAEVLYVYVCGHVKNPGVYLLDKGSRRFQAVEAAGGIEEDGCVEFLELAGVLADGERIYVPSAQEAEETRLIREEEQNGLVNLNQASKEQLMTLPGIGESRAEAILQYRENNGAFQSIEDIMKVSGIKEAAFTRIKNLICV